MDQAQNATPKSDATMSTTTKIIGGFLVIVIAITLWLFYGTMRDIDSERERMAAPVTLEVGTPEEVAASEAAVAEATVTLSTQSTSDELGSIEADLGATDLEILGDPSAL